MPSDDPKIIGRAFVVRPFGKKKNSKGEQLDFEEIHAELIAPALKQAGLAGETTTEFIHQGNIREEMFHELLVADLVIADISLHNANAFYELGMRHALRERATFLIRADKRSDEGAFDLATDRYMTYDPDDPAAGIDALAAALKATIDRHETDSPVFKLLPGLSSANPADVIVVPRQFAEEVELRKEDCRMGDLQLLAHEARGLPWESEGLRLVGRAQFHLEDFHGARTTWQRFRDLDELDTEANRRLATLCQRLGKYTESDQAIRRVLATDDLSGSDLAEFHSLEASNEKSRWRQAWEDEPDATGRQRAALLSPHLENAAAKYNTGFLYDRNHYYSGLNALAMLRIGCELAQAHRDIWDDEFDGDEARATIALQDKVRLADQVAAAVGLAIETALARNSEDRWATISRADLAFLTRSARRVSSSYRMVTAVSGFTKDSARRQIELYRSLGILEENCAAALSVLGGDEAPRDEIKAPHVILFTGHRVDQPHREAPRFPRTENARETARRLIEERVSRIRALEDGLPQDRRRPLLGLAGGASGGDLLFHDVCEQHGIESDVYLALPKPVYLRESVADGGEDWVRRFEHHCARKEPRLLTESDRLPRWLTAKPGYTIWDRSNLWMLYNALTLAQGNVTLVSLWNGEGGDGPGGTADMIRRAQHHGARHLPIDAKALVS